MIMMHSTLKFLLSALAAAVMVPASAQTGYVTEAPAGGFDFSTAKDIVVLYAPDEAITKMGDKIKSNQNLDPTNTNNQFFYWVTDWDKKDLTLVNVDREGATNSYGGSNMLSITPQWAWGTGYFGAIGSYKYDLSMIDDDYYLHLGLCDFGNADSKYKFEFGNTDVKGNHFDLEVNLDKGKTNGDFVGVGNMKRDGKWYYIDIPVKDLVDEDGDFGFSYDWSSKITNPFLFSFDSPTTSKMSKVLEPGAAVYTYTITKLNSAVSIDGVYFYKKDSASTGIKTVSTARGKADGAWYNLHGMRVEKPSKGVFIHNGRKVVVK